MLCCSCFACVVCWFWGYCFVVGGLAILLCVGWVWLWKGLSFVGFRVLRDFLRGLISVLVVGAISCSYLVAGCLWVGVAFNCLRLAWLFG